MTKGTYNIAASSSNDQPRPSADGSFRSCLCAMLIVLAICCILLLIMWPLSYNKQPYNPDVEEVEESTQDSSRQFERIIIEITTRKSRFKPMETTSVINTTVTDKITTLNETGVNPPARTTEINEIKSTTLKIATISTSSGITEGVVLPVRTTEGNSMTSSGVTEDVVLPVRTTDRNSMKSSTIPTSLGVTQDVDLPVRTTERNSMKFSTLSTSLSVETEEVNLPKEVTERNFIKSSTGITSSGVKTEEVNLAESTTENNSMKSSTIPTSSRLTEDVVSPIKTTERFSIKSSTASTSSGDETKDVDLPVRTIERFSMKSSTIPTSSGVAEDVVSPITTTERFSMKSSIASTSSGIKTEDIDLSVRTTERNSMKSSTVSTSSGAETEEVSLPLGTTEINIIKSSTVLTSSGIVTENVNLSARNALESSTIPTYSSAENENINLSAKTIENSTEMNKINSSAIEFTRLPVTLRILTENLNLSASTTSSATTESSKSKNIWNKSDKNENLTVEQISTYSNSSTSTTHSDPIIVYEINETDEYESTDQPALKLNKTNLGIEETASLLSALKQPQPVCQRTGCKFTAARMLSRMNHLADPCEDFYEFACGGDESQETSSTSIRKRIGDKLAEIDRSGYRPLKLFRKFQDNCIEFFTEFNYEQRIRTGKELLEMVSHMYDRTQQLPKELTLTELLTRLLLVDSSPLFDISMDVDKQTQRFIFQITLGGNSVLNEKRVTKLRKKCLRQIQNYFTRNEIDLNFIYEKYFNCQLNHSDYLNTIEMAVRSLGGFSHLDEYNKTWHMQNLRTTIEWDILSKLEELPRPNITRFNTITKKYKMLKVSELKLKYPLIEWKRLLTRLAQRPVDDEQLVQLYFSDYFQSLFKQLETLPAWQIHNAILAMYAHDLYTNFVTNTGVENPEQFCLEQSIRLLPEIASSIYLSTWRKEDYANLEQNFHVMFEQLKTNFIDAVQDAEWLDDQSRISILIKVKKIKLITDNGWDVWMNGTILNERIENLRNLSDGYQFLTIALLKRHRQLSYQLLGQDASGPENIWFHFLRPYDLDLKSIYAMNAILIPLGRWQSQSKDLPRYVYLTQIAYALAKEVSRHFDTTAINYDMTLTKNSNTSYMAMETCGVDKYSFALSQRFRQKIVSFQINGKLSLNERLTDDMAIKLVSDTVVDTLNDPLLPWVSDNYSREKIFFLIIAQESCRKTSMNDYLTQLFESEHLPVSIMVNSFLKNFPLFGETFDCRSGSGMVDAIKCDPFPRLQKNEDYYQYGSK